MAPQIAVDADVAPFDHCDRLWHFVACPTKTGPCPAGYAWHHCWDTYTRYHCAEACPNANETVDGAWTVCATPDAED